MPRSDDTPHAPRLPRTLFDPAKIAGPPPVEQSPARRERAASAPPPAEAVGERDGNDDGRITVSELATRIDAALRDGFPLPVRVLGEISGFKEQTHWYFALKDDAALINCVMFAGQARRVSFRPENGRQVVASGRVEHYPKRGQTQLYVTALEPAGLGPLDLRFRALCDELRALGWFDEPRKRPLPAFPRRVAILTSRTGAALSDCLDTMRRRCPAVEALIVDVRVQGAAAAPGVARAIRSISRRHKSLGVDALLLTRGGGSLEDLWAFNERIVAHAIVECAIPVVAAIGHETDVTIAELVADVRAATPTAAAMRLTPDRAALAELLERSAARLRRAALLNLPTKHVADLHRRLRRAGAAITHLRALRLERLASRLTRLRPEAVYAARRAHLSDLRSRLHHAMRARLRAADLAPAKRALTRAARHAFDSRRQRLEALDRALAIAGPASVLHRGFSITLGPNGRVLRSVHEASPGDRIETRLTDGALHSTVDGGAATPPARRSRKSPPRGAAPGPSQMDLFRRNP